MSTRFEAEAYRAQLQTMMKLSLILDGAGERVLGKGAPAMMYQAGRDEGLAQNLPGGRSEIEDALMEVLVEGEDIWQVDRWMEPGQSTLWQEKGDRKTSWLVFRRCPLLTLSRRVGTTPGGLLCQAFHGFLAGSMERMLGSRIDIRVGHCGPRACKLVLEMRD